MLNTILNDNIEQVIQNLVHKAISSVIEHYDQPIYSCRAIVEAAPYFDELLGHPPCYTSIIEHWSNTLLSYSEENIIQKFEAKDDVLMKEQGKNMDLERYHKLTILIYVLQYYTKIVRPKCFRLHQKDDSVKGFYDTASTILIQYEMLLNRLSTLINHEDNAQDVSFSNDSYGGSEKKVRSISIAIKTIRDAVFAISMDIFSITSLSCLKSGQVTKDCANEKVFSEKENENGIMFSDWILPILIQLLFHSNRMLNEIVEYGCRCKTQNLFTFRCIHMIEESFGMSILVVLSFCPNLLHNSTKQIPSHLNFKEVAPSQLNDELSLKHVIETCAYSPNFLLVTKDQFHSNSKKIRDKKNAASSNDNEYLINLVNKSSIIFKDSLHNTKKEQENSPYLFLSKPAINLETSSSKLEMPWVDCVKGNSFRTARRLFFLIARAVRDTCSIIKIDHQKNEKCCDSKKHRNVNWKVPLNYTILEKVVSKLGTINLLSMARAHFFGRISIKECDTSLTSINNHAQEKKTNLTNFGDQIIKTKHDEVSRQNAKIPEDQPFNIIPARIVPAVRILASLRFPNVTESVLDIALPILFTLIDSYNAVHQILGSAILFHILQECTSTAFMGSVDSNGANFFTTTAQVLKLACRSCQDSVALCILSKVRSRIFEIIGPSEERRYGKLRREATADLMTSVNTLSYSSHNTHDECDMLGGILVGGVSSLLKQHANRSNADTMELGRLGLYTLLLIIKRDSTSRKSMTVKLAAIVCLISLMMGAYPILTNHGGKIMSGLISCIGRGQRDLIINTNVRDSMRSKVNNQSYSNGCNEVHERHHDVNICTKYVIALALHASSITLILCGGKSENVLITIEEGNYIQSLKECCLLIRHKAEMMIALEEERKLQI